MLISGDAKESSALRNVVLLLTAFICGWHAVELGFFADDQRILWWIGGSPHPRILIDGRFSDYFFVWVFWNIFGTQAALFHVFVVLLHLLVVNELFQL